MPRIETYQSNGVTYQRDNGPSGPHDMTDRELRDMLKGFAPNNACQMGFADLVKRYGGLLEEVRKRKLHITPGSLFSDEEQWVSFIEKRTSQSVGYCELFDAGVQVLSDPKHTRVMVTVADVVEAGRKALVDQLATAPTIAEHGGDRKSDQGDKIENITLKTDRGTSSAYRLGKIKRDHPELAERIIAGEFKSVSEAERAAGLRPPLLTDYEKAQRAFWRLTEEDQERFRDWLK